MANNNDLSNSENILVKVDQNNLMYIDPNSVISNGEIMPRSVNQEKLAMFVNLEADIVPRSILVAGNGTSTLQQVAKGTLNFLSSQKKGDRDFSTSWTDAYVEKPRENSGTDKIKDDYEQSDGTGESFGIESINISVKGNFIPQVNINFIDVRGKTLFESAENSPYKAFFHIPWPIFYLTVKGYYGKAIRYRLHLVKFNSRFNDTNGNFEVQTTFVGSTYAYMNDIPLKGIINAPYMFMKEGNETVKFNEQTGRNELKVTKSSKGYQILKSVYSEMKAKKLIPQDFPVKTIKEIGVIAKSLDKLLEKVIFDEVIDTKVLSGLKDYENNLVYFEKEIKNWGNRNLSKTNYEVINEIIFYSYKETIKDKKSLDPITGTTNTSLDLIVTNFSTKLKSSALFNKELQKKGKKGVEYNFRVKQIGNTSDYYRTNGQIKNNVIVSIDKLVSDIQEMRKVFNEQRTIIEKSVEKRMNEVIKDKTKGIGFEPTVRNIFAVLLANAEVYVRLMKDIHQDAFNIANERKNQIKNFDKETLGDSIFPWPEIKKTDPGTKKRIIAYPGEPELRSQLKSFNRVLWPEVSFVEEYLSVSTNRTDPIAENGVNDLDYIFESNLAESQINQISSFFETNDTIPYYDRSISSILYEIYERAKQITLIDSFTTKTLTELVEIEFKTLKEILGEEIDIVGVLSNNINSKDTLLELMYNFSPFERHPYYTDSIPTVEYIKSIIDSPFKIEQYDKNSVNTKNIDDTLYSNLSLELKTYEPESYRKNIYPFNSSTYLSYLNVDNFKDEEFKFNGNLTIDTKNGFICSPISPKSWMKENYRKNVFLNKLNIGETYVNILNTPYFHKQLYTDFFKDNSYAKYVGSAYLFLNSLPFHDLEDKITFSGVEVDSTSGAIKSKTLPAVRMSSLFREVSSTAFVPYHLLLKWGSIYHRYKEYILNNNDILTGFTSSNITQPIDGNLFFNNNETGVTFTAFTVSAETITYSGTTGDLGTHPYYDAIYHQFLNDYNHYVISSGDTSYSSNVTVGAIRSRSRLQQNNLKYWTNFVDNSIFDTEDKRYTILPSDGSNKNINREVIAGVEVINGDSFSKGTQSNFRCIWEDDYINDTFSGKTFPKYNEYNKSYVTGTTSQRVQYDNIYAIDDNYRKVIDLIATFSPKILDQFEDMFLQFATERLNEEIPYKKFEKVKHDNFQNMLKEILTVEKLSSDPTTLSSSDTTIVIGYIKDRQISKLERVTNDILSVDNLIKITLSNPKEIDSYVLEGFVQKSGNTLTFNSYDISQTGNTKYIKLYVGEDIDGYYLDFFDDMNIELSEDNVLLLRPLILIYGGYRKTNGVANRPSFKTYLNEKILTSTTAIPKLGADNRLSFYLTQLTQKFSQLKINEENNTINFVDGFNNRILKVELYNFFKSFNDKWSAGNSIGQRLLLEEFLFLDKANKDIGDKAFLNLTRFLSILDEKNDKANLYSTISMLIQGTGFDLRPLPAYVNFYGTNITTKGKITPSKRVAENLFGTFLEVDYEESSPKMIIQFTGPQSRHPSDMNTKYKFKDDSFNVANVNDNPLIVTLPDVFDVENLNKSNKVVAFEVSFGDQYQSIFKGIQLDQSSLRNTSESFVVLENLARSESGAGAYNVDIGLFDYYRQASYSCEVMAMGNVMIQPTMYFYLKNVPMFRGTYWITEVSHSIRNNNIVTNFKGSRVPIASLPDPEDSFVSSYRPLFDKIMNAANILQTASNKTTTETVIQTDKGNYVVDYSGITINGESPYKETPLVGINQFGVPYNGYGNEKYIQRITYKNKTYFRAIVARMGSEIYPISDDTSMSVVSRLKNYTVVDSTGKSGLKWSELKTFNDSMKFYSLKFQLSDVITADKISTAVTTFLNPNNNDKEVSISPVYNVNRQSQTLNVQGPVNIGPNVNGYGIGMSYGLMNELGVHEGQVIYFNFQ